MQIKNRRCSISDSGASALQSSSKAGFRQTLLCDGKVPLSPALLTDALEELRPLVEARGEHTREFAELWEEMTSVRRSLAGANW